VTVVAWRFGWGEELLRSFLAAIEEEAGEWLCSRGVPIGALASNLNGI
jgi:hypothetical protein